MNKHSIVNLKCPCFLFRYPNLDIPSQALFNLYRASALPLWCCREDDQNFQSPPGHSRRPVGRRRFCMVLVCNQLGHWIRALNYGTQLRHSVTSLKYFTQLRHSITALNYSTQMWHSITVFNYNTHLQHSITALNYSTQVWHSNTALNYVTQ